MNYDRNTVLRTINISGIVTALLPEGKQKRVEWKARCPSPSHEDLSPSFSINLATGRYICFGCGMSGDIFRLYALMKGGTYSDAINQLGRGER